jgi:hypothetical protein
MPDTAPNLNLRRRLLPGLLALFAAVPLRGVLFPFRRKASPGTDQKPPLWVFSSYMVGDLFMALPALKMLAARIPVRVLCRPDCAELLRREGLDAVPFDNAFFVRRTPAAFLRTLRSAWSLRRLPASKALDLDADPRTALWMRVAGSPHVVSFRRPFGVLFDETFDLPQDAIHQADKDLAVAGAFSPGLSFSIPVLDASSPNASWLLSVWTRKPEKNWPLSRWEELMERMEREGVSFAVLDAPDGDEGFRAFRARWRGRAEFVSGPLEAISERARGSAGIVATDNFLGHMGGHHGKRVLWINVCSPAAQVAPRGPRTLIVGSGAPGKPVQPSVDEAWRVFRELLA